MLGFSLSLMSWDCLHCFIVAFLCAKYFIAYIYLYLLYIYYKINEVIIVIIILIIRNRIQWANKIYFVYSEKPQWLYKCTYCVCVCLLTESLLNCSLDASSDPCWRFARVLCLTEAAAELAFSPRLLRRLLCTATGLHIANPALVLSLCRPVLGGQNTAERFGLTLCSGWGREEGEREGLFLLRPL